MIEVVYPTISRLYTIDSAVMGKPTIQSGPRKATSIPRPTGEQSVGCVDLMHQVVHVQCDRLHMVWHVSLSPLSLKEINVVDYW